MNRAKLEKEGRKWVDEGLISAEQFESILAQYEQKDHSYLLVILAALLISIGIIIFIFSDWAQVGHISRVLMMLLIMLFLYAIGIYYYRKAEKEQTEVDRRSEIIGISFIVLGYIMFGATIFLTLYIYHVQLLSAWPFIIWSLAGLFLFVIFPNRFLFTIALLITIYGQIHSSLSFSSFDIFLFLIFLFGYFHFVYHQGNTVYHYVFSAGLSIQLVVLVMNEFEQMYWFILFILLMFGLAQFMKKNNLQRRMVQITIITMFIYKLFETMLVQESYFLEELAIEPSFLILWAIAFVAIGFIVLKTDKKESITLILFLPLLFLPSAHIFIMISLFVYSLFWLIYGFQFRNERKVTLGIISFLMSSFIVIVQFTWETLNKSLFFLIAGILLFIISAIFERRRRKHHQGGDSK